MGYKAFEKLCIERGYKPAYVSKATGVSTATLSSWKSGKYKPKQDKIQKIADFFGVPSSVFNDEDTDLHFGNGDMGDLIASKPSYMQPTYNYRQFRKDLLALADSFPAEPEGAPVYYRDEETARLAQEMFEDKDMRALFHMKRGMSKEKFAAHMNMMKELYRLEHPEDHPEDFE